MKKLPLHPACLAALLLLASGCAALAPDKPATQPEAVAKAQAPVAPAAASPAKPAPAARAAAPAPLVAGKAEISAAKVPAPPPAAKAPAAPAAAPNAQAAKHAPSAPATLDLNALKDQLKETKAIGVFTKITLKNQVDDLLQQFRDYYQGKVKLTLAELRRSYDLLLMKVLALLQDADQKLASAIVSSREAIWGLLSDPKKFATLEG